MIVRFPDKPYRMSQDRLEQLDKEGVWIAQAKKDGWRAHLIHTPNDTHECWSRHDKRLDTERDFDQGIIEVFKAMNTPKDTILDGEWLRRRAGNALGLNIVSVWGILRLNGSWLANEIEEKRWALTQELKVDNKLITIPECVRTGFKQFFEDMQKDPANEGIVLKHKNSRLILDRKESKDNPLWIKIKWRDGADGKSEAAF